jgi:hypothetical protein
MKNLTEYSHSPYRRRARIGPSGRGNPSYVGVTLALTGGWLCTGGVLALRFPGVGTLSHRALARRTPGARIQFEDQQLAGDAAVH